MHDKISKFQSFDWADLTEDASYRSWCDAKKYSAESSQQAEPVEIGSLDSPDPKALKEIERRCAANNFAVYSTTPAPIEEAPVAAGLLRFAAALGLRLSEHHRSAGEDGVVALRTSSDASKRGFIPYTPRAMNWHTDGYYNAPEARIAAFILHCHAPAASGGANQLIDPEIAYMRLRDENPAYVEALMHPQAMTIPAHEEKDGALRPDSIGPVFFADPATGRLQMRYTARTRSISWRDDALTREAVDWMKAWMAEEPLTANISLAAGQGVVNNNVLHNRTGYEDGDGARVVFRVRFMNRVTEETDGPT